MDSHTHTAAATRPFTIRVAIGGVLALTGLAGLSGCEVQSFMDPSQLGAFNHTPRVMPILDRIAVIEDRGAAVEYSDPLPADLLPVPTKYRLSPGDRVTLVAWDLIEPGRSEELELTIDTRGFLPVPQLGDVYVAKMTQTQAEEAVMQAMKRLVPNPLAQIRPMSQRQQVFTLVGAVNQPGQYFIPDSDYRLSEALTAGGQIDSNAPYVYVIRQVRLSDQARGLTGGNENSSNDQVQPNAPMDPSKFDELLNTITNPDGPKSTPSPAALAKQPDATKPAIDLPERMPPAANAQPSTPASSGLSDWVFLNGQWVRLQEDRAPAQPGGTPGGDIATQRIIRIPLKKLLDEGRREVNIVVRPGDVIRIPPLPSGFVYMGGNVGRPGPYQLPANGLFTVRRAIVSSGGLGTFAIPERTELTRIVGEKRQATIRINLRAIANETEPDIILKPDDLINVGTNFWAQPLAVIRNGFRMSYGFGFLLDRNFDTEVYGARRIQQN